MSRGSAAFCAAACSSPALCGNLTVSCAADGTCGMVCTGGEVGEGGLAEEVAGGGLLSSERCHRPPSLLVGASSLRPSSGAVAFVGTLKAPRASAATISGVRAGV